MARLSLEKRLGPLPSLVNSTDYFKEVTAYQGWGQLHLLNYNYESITSQVKF